MMMGNIVRLLQLWCLLVSFCQTLRHSENSDGIKMEKRICPTKFPDVDDTLGYDFISQYDLDKVNSSTESERIPGSNEHQTAFRIGRRSDLRVPTRMAETTPLREWDIFRIEDADARLQFAIGINSRKKSIRLKFTNSRNKIRAIEFSLDNKYFIKFFNSEWHKLSLSVSHRLVQLYVDCDKVGSSVIPNFTSINSSGQIVSGRRADGIHVEFDLQWLMLYCDPKSAERDQCRDIQNSTEKPATGGVQLSQQDEVDDSDDDADSQEIQNEYDEGNRRRYSALTLSKRTIRGHSMDSEDVYSIAAQIRTGTLLSTGSPSVNKKKSNKGKPPQYVQSSATGPPGPPGHPGLPGLPGMPCNCRPGVPLPPLSIDNQELERNHRLP